MSRGGRGARLRRTRDVGLPRVHLGHLLTAAGFTVRRLGDGFLETSRAQTRVTPCARLLAESTAASPDETSPAVSKATMTRHPLHRWGMQPTLSGGDPFEEQ